MELTFRQALDLITHLASNSRELENATDKASKIINMASVTRFPDWYYMQLNQLLDYICQSIALLQSRLDQHTRIALYGSMKNRTAPQNIIEAKYHVYHDFSPDSFRILLQVSQGNKCVDTDSICKQLSLLYAVKIDVQASKIKVEYLIQQRGTKSRNM